MWTHLNLREAIVVKGAQMWYQQEHDILLQYWSGPHEFVFYFSKRSRKNQEESNNQWWTCDQWDLLPNQHALIPCQKYQKICIVFHNERIYISAFIQEVYVCGTSVVQVQVCYISKVARSKAHNIRYVNSYNGIF